MEGLFRRGGVWYARLVIPARLRQAAGRTEFVASTGVREPVLAKVVAAELLAAWRRKLHDFSRLASGSMNLEQVAVGHPRLAAVGYLSISEAAEFAGLDEELLLQAAGEGQLRLYVHAADIDGWLFPSDALTRYIDDAGTELIVPSVDAMPGVTGAARLQYAGMLLVRAAHTAASLLLADKPVEAFCFDLQDRPGYCFRPASHLWLRLEDIRVLALDVDKVRKRLALTISADQLESMRRNASRPLQLRQSDSRKRFSEVIDQYMAIRSGKCGLDQAKRIRAALVLFAELEGDPRLCDIDAKRLEHYRDEILPRVPANENKVRLQHGTTSVAESIKVVEALGGELISAGEQLKKLQWLRAAFQWLAKKKLIHEDPSTFLVDESRVASTVFKASQARAANERRDRFTPSDLQDIFTAGKWFSTGRGALTAAGTYREFLPYYYWLPLLGLYTGARINELAQLYLVDIKKTVAGVWYLSIGELDEGGKKRLKNAGSRRNVPIHSSLLALGLIQWKCALEKAGYARLFPELSHDELKGFGKAATKWFSAYLKRLGWPRDNRKVFHSFRGTLVSVCMNELGMKKHDVARISGHAVDGGTFADYIKGGDPAELVESVEKLKFSLPRIAKFDCDEGLKAVEDALRRKNRGRGGVEVA